VNAGDELKAALPLVIETRKVKGRQAQYVALRVACGWVARCDRPRGHRGQHGGFRAIHGDDR
jgi:hypothetical protein